MSLAVVFPGQGSQTVGMLNEFATNKNLQHTFAEASQVLGYDLWELIQNGPQTQLDQTEYTQPAMLVADVALYRLWQAQQPTPVDFMAGHSLGEFAALVCAGALALEDAVQLVQARGRLMQQTVAVGLGAMAAIVGLNDEQIREICNKAAQYEILEPANYNAIGQTVIAGNAEAVLRALPLAEAQGARLAKIIPVSVPCHCQLLIPASVEFAKVLHNITFKPPQITVINNADVKHIMTVEQIKDSLTRQLYQPVRWVEIIQLFYAAGVDSLIECGPGNVLSGLCKRIERNIKAQSILSLLGE